MTLYYSVRNAEVAANTILGRFTEPLPELRTNHVTCHCVLGQRLLLCHTALIPCVADHRVSRSICVNYPQQICCGFIPLRVYTVTVSMFCIYLRYFPRSLGQAHLERYYYSTLEV